MTVDNSAGGFGMGFRNPGVVIANQVIIFGNNNGLFVYSGTTPALGNLIATIAGTGGTDPYGNVYVGGGLASYGGGFTNYLGLVGGVPELQFKTGLANESIAGNIAGGVVGVGAAETMQMLMSGPKGTAVGGRDWAQVYLISNNSGVTAPASGQLRFISDTGTVTEPLTWDVNGVELSNSGTVPPANPVQTQLYSSASHLKYVGKDGNAYNTGTLRKTKTTTQNITSTTAQTVTWDDGISTMALTTGTTYRMDCLIRAQQITAAVADVFQFVSTATLTFSSLAFSIIPVPGTQASTAVYNVVQLNANISTPTYAINQSYWIKVEGFFTTSTAGALSLVAAQSAAGDQFNVQGGSFLDLMPIT
jgi:hypothetical protein